MKKYRYESYHVSLSDRALSEFITTHGLEDATIVHVSQEKLDGKDLYGCRLYSYMIIFKIPAKMERPVVLTEDDAKRFLANPEAMRFMPYVSPEAIMKATDGEIKPNDNEVETCVRCGKVLIDEDSEETKCAWCGTKISKQP